MTLYTVAIIHFLKLDESIEKIKIDKNVTIYSPKANKIPELFTEKYKAYIGMDEANNYNLHPYIIVTHKNIQNDDLEIAKYHKIARTVISNYISSTWFVIDNSFQTHRIHSYSPSLKYAITTTPQSKQTNSIGKAEPTILDYKNLRKAKSITKLVTNLLPNQILEPRNIEIKDEPTFMPSQFSTTDQSTTTNFQRAIALLDDARKTSLKTAKITFYCSVLESILSTSNSEVTNQISIRTALFLGKNKDQRTEIYRIVKKAYDIRSCFIHGNKINSQTDKLLPDFSKKMDQITRQLFINLLTQKKDFLDLKGNQIEDYFLNKLFN
ncbi:MULTISPECIES: hypothetical protein [unclassified Paraflavitalea]|uniref:hypothetical protein n=1 Tax=unclassified Paraflavitalea TaxID=2798305 RepID=UPI003D34704A